MEPLSQLSGMASDGSTEAAAVPSFVEFSQKMVQNLFNYSSSFAVTPAELMGSSGVRPTDTFVPFSTLQSWYSNFERRLQQNPYFWKN